MRNRFDLARHFNEQGFKVGAEIGVAAGDYSLALCEAIPGLELYCIDPWKKYTANPRGGDQARQDGNKEAAIKKLAPYNAHLIPAMSMVAVKEFVDGALDFVFIDGHHGYPYVRDDIIEWSKKVRSGGIVSGHDYYDFDNSGVIQAVDDYVEEYGLDLNVIPEDPRALRRDNRHPCFWWVKP